MCASYGIEDTVCCCKDQLNLYPEDANFVINYSSSNDGNGSHWVALVIDEKTRLAYYSDSFARKPLPQIVAYCKKRNMKGLFYNTEVLQNASTSDCGWFALSMLYVMQKQKTKSMDAYCDLFSGKKYSNDEVLKQIFTRQ